MSTPREIDVDPAAVTWLDSREELDPVRRDARRRMTVGTTPDGTAVVLDEDLTADGEADQGGLVTVRAYASVDAAREDRDHQITLGYRAEDISTHIRSVPAYELPDYTLPTWGGLIEDALGDLDTARTALSETTDWLTSAWRPLAPGRPGQPTGASDARDRAADLVSQAQALLSEAEDALRTAGLPAKGHT